MHLELATDTLLIFLDETGQEKFKDKNYPIFGYGGCALMGRDYETLIYNPWREIKHNNFGDLNYRFHSTTIGKPNVRLEIDLSTFFESLYFSRFAVVAKEKTFINPSLTAYQSVFFATLLGIKNICKSYSDFTSITLVFESSERIDKLVEQHFASAVFTINNMDIPVYKYFMSKQRSEPGLEVADYIVHAAGRNEMNRRRGLASETDANYIFRNIPQHLQYYLGIDIVDYKN